MPRLGAPYAKRIELIARDRTHGGGWLAREAVQVLIDAIQLGEPPLEIARALVAARPTMAAIAGALGRVLAAGTTERMVDEAQAVLATQERAPRAIAVQLRDALTGTVMTHSASATVREALLYAGPRRIVCTASQPYGEGRRFAAQLRDAGLAVELVDDEAGPRAVREVDRLLVGADTVFQEGTLLNKVGTRALAAAANEAGISVDVACEVIKLAPVAPPAELSVAEASERDLTRSELIDSFVTEEGAFAPAGLAALIDRTPFLREGSALSSAADHGIARPR